MCLMCVPNVYAERMRIPSLGTYQAPHAQCCRPFRPSSLSCHQAGRASSNSAPSSTAPAQTFPAHHRVDTDIHTPKTRHSLIQPAAHTPTSTAMSKLYNITPRNGTSPHIKNWCVFENSAEAICAVRMNKTHSKVREHIL